MSNFTWADGSLVLLYLVGTMTAGLLVRKYVGKVEDFLIAGREVNVYLGIASLAATEFGVVTCMYTAELGYRYGFAGATGGLAMAAAMLVVGLTGFGVKPLRDAGAITIPELFEKRFGPRIRWMSGVVIVLGGLLNMGVFLRTGGDFLVQVLGVRGPLLAVPADLLPCLPLSLQAISIDAARADLGLQVAMTALLVFVAIYTVLGGMLSVLVTDYLQFIVMSAGLLAVTVLILLKVGWSALVTAVEQKAGAGGFNPLVHPDLGWDYVVFQVLINTAAVLTWQTTIQRVLAAKDTRTGLKIYRGTSFFFVCRFLIPGLWGIAALATLGPAVVGDKTQLAMPLFLSTFVPPVMMGLLVAAMLAADMSTDSSYMLTWGSVIYNDILAPFRRTKWPEARGLRWNRAIVAAIGLFLLVYGLWYPLKGSIWSYLTVTGSIYLSSMSILLIACCYWKRANNWGAAGAILVGSAIPIAYLVLKETAFPPDWATSEHVANYFGIVTYLLAAAAMIVGSLLKPPHGRAGRGA